MSLLSLNDDVLLAIFATLYGKDALHVSLTSKRAYTLAGPCIASRIECTSPKRLRRIHTYLLAASSDGGLRARFLKFLWIDRGAFEDPLAECPYDHPKYDFSQVHLVREILLQASNLRELWIAGFQACIERDARIWDTIQSLTGLVDLQLFDVTDSSLTIFDSFRSDYLTRLTLTYRRSRSKAEIPISPLPSLPSIRHLRLHEPTMFALDLVGRCPNLSALIVSFIQKTQPRDLPGACGGSQWPSLRRLMVSELQDVRSFSERLRTVGSLQICGMLDCRSGGDLALLEVLRQTSPVGLYVSIQTSCQEPLFWDAIPSAAPRLRSLELQLQRLSGCSIPEAYSWLSKLPAALSSIPLVCLRVLVPELQGQPNIVLEGQRNHGREREIKRIKALIALPCLLVRAIPSLRYLSVGDLAPNTHVTGVPIADAALDALRLKAEDFVVTKWDEMRWLDIIRMRCWWRIEDGPSGSPRELVEISEEEGEEAQRQIESVN
ncbi:hypothetical protein OH76DRAFT_1476452 [Lentinus brumalis]|uniref:F-box domain-containing protein n=1 Tax=Lentinus brumalis TaxID=2498619 RepID=A0A371DWN8_9APHY|nr:hypothetical protein OH76DRAFT_1476452 [Polyporus brumalis]